MEREWFQDDEELLEAHLDGALTPEDGEALWRRLAAEQELLAELERLRAERVVRAAVWAAGEPTAGEAEQVAEEVVSAAAHARRWERAAWFGRRAAASAAAVALAFAAGWTVRGRYEPAGPTTVRAVVPARPAGMAPAGMAPAAAAGADERRPSFPVTLTDELGNVIAVQHFDDARTARQFAEDVDRWQSRPRGRAEVDSVTPVSGEF